MAAQEDPENNVSKRHQFVLLCLCLVLACATCEEIGRYIGPILTIESQWTIGGDVSYSHNIKSLGFDLNTLSGDSVLKSYMISFDLLSFMDF